MTIKEISFLVSVIALVVSIAAAVVAFIKSR